MQALTDALWAILASKFQAGPSAPALSLEVGTAVPAGTTTPWEVFGRDLPGPDIGPTTGGRHYEWQQLLFNIGVTDPPAVRVDGTNFVYQNNYPNTGTITEYILASDEWWSDYDFDVTMTFEVAAQSDPDFNQDVGMRLGDTAQSDFYDGNYAFAKINLRTGQLTVGNGVTDHFAAGALLPAGEGPCKMRWQHDATVSRMKVWRAADAEPGWGVTRSDVAADLITGNMFGFFVSFLSGFGGFAGPDETVALLDLRIDSIDPGVLYASSETSFTWSALRAISAEVDKSFNADSDSMTVVLSNKDGAIQVLADSPVIDQDTPLRLKQWYGAVDNAVTTFLGLADSAGDHRDPHQVTVQGKDRMKILLTGNLTDIGMNLEGYLVEEAVNVVLDAAGWPTSKRRITATNATVAGFEVQLAESYCALVRRLANIVAFDIRVDEDGVFIFEPLPSAVTGVTTDDPVVPVATFSGALEVMVLDAGLDDDGLCTRVQVIGPEAVAPTEDWQPVWQTGIINHPNGIWAGTYNYPKVWVIDGHTRKVYEVDPNYAVVAPFGPTTFTKTALSPALSSNSLSGGMDGDDPDSNSYLWVLETPYRNAADGLPSSGDPCKIRKVRISDWTTVSSHSLGFGTWTAIKATDDYLWVTRYDTQKIKKIRKSDYVTVDTIDVSAMGSPTGLAVKGTEIWVFAGGQISVFDISDPSTVIATHDIPGSVGGGEFDVADPTLMYADFQDLGLVYQYRLMTPGIPAIGASAVDWALEHALGERAGVEPRIHGCPDHAYDAGGEQAHPWLAILAEPITDDTLTSNEQAYDVARRELARVSRKNRTVQIGIPANPGIQKGDPIEVHDPLSGLIHQLVMVEEYRTNQDSRSYTGVISGPLWVTESV